MADARGTYGLLPITEGERVARRVLLEGEPDAAVHVVDAKNRESMLPMTFQLIEGWPILRCRAPQHSGNDWLLVLPSL